jgi:chromosome segregation ATPase
VRTLAKQVETLEPELERVTTERDRETARADGMVQDLSDARSRADAAERDRERLADQVESLRNEAAAAGPLRDEIAYAREQIQRLENRLYERIGAQ